LKWANTQAHFDRDDGGDEKNVFIISPAVTLKISLSACA